MKATETMTADEMQHWEADLLAGGQRKEKATHGSYTMYSHYGCRCDLCRAAGSIKNREYREHTAARKAQSLRDEVQAILGEEHPYGAVHAEAGGNGRAAQPQARQDDDVSAGPQTVTAARPYSFTAAPCPHCGQLALVGVGRCACQIPQQEGQE